MSETTQLIYIMGRGHSGSTVLDAMLGNACDIESVGELVSGIGHPDDFCSCGRTFAVCPFWQQVCKEFEQGSGLDWGESIFLIVRQAYITQFTKALLTDPNTPYAQKLVQINRELTHAILRVSGKQCVVDSSKEHTRALFLARLLPEVKIIHLVRNPVGILASNLHRIRYGSGFKFLRRKYRNRSIPAFFLTLSSINWFIGNLLAEVVCFLAPHRVLRVRYEDLCDDPRGELQRIATFSGYDLAQVMDAAERGQEMEIGHNIGGNHLRMAGTFVFDPSSGSKKSLPWIYQAMVQLLTWPMMLRHGYRLFYSDHQSKQNIKSLSHD